MGEADGCYLSQAAVGVFVRRAAVRAVAAARLLLFIQQRRGVGQGILQRLTSRQRNKSEASCEQQEEDKQRSVRVIMF